VSAHTGTAPKSSSSTLDSDPRCRSFRATPGNRAGDRYDANNATGSPSTSASRSSSVAARSPERERDRAWRAHFPLSQQTHLDLEAALPHVRGERREDRHVVDEGRLAEERPLPPRAVEDALVDEIEDRLADRSERHAELGRQITLGWKRLAAADLTPLDHLDEEMAKLVVQRHRRIAVQSRQPAGCDSHRAKL
jgi:hypothetical protein